MTVLNLSPLRCCVWPCHCFWRPETTQVQKISSNFAVPWYVHLFVQYTENIIVATGYSTHSFFNQLRNHEKTFQRQSISRHKVITTPRFPLCGWRMHRQDCKWCWQSTVSWRSSLARCCSCTHWQTHELQSSLWPSGVGLRSVFGVYCLVGWLVLFVCLF